MELGSCFILPCPSPLPKPGLSEHVVPNRPRQQDPQKQKRGGIKQEGRLMLLFFVDMQGSHLDGRLMYGIRLA